jgi:serine/threonine-protein phosphatase 5
MMFECIMSGLSFIFCFHSTNLLFKFLYIPLPDTANRAFCNLKLELYGLAVADATEAIEIDADYVKAYYRRGSARLAMCKFKEALPDFKHVIKLKPKDKDARQKYDECAKAIKTAAFEAAIMTEQTKPVSETINLDSIIIPDYYSGIHMPWPITLEFVMSMVESFRNQKLIHKKYVYQMLIELKKMFADTPSLMNISLPEKTEGYSPKFSVCGDTHGQYYDLLNIFEINGYPSPQNPYLFNGDFVDRGSFSFENVMTLLSFKLLYPTGMYLTRGNHETTNMNKIYGFEGEVKAKYDETCMKLFTEVFNNLPLCGVIASKVIVVHGGLFQKDGVTLQDITNIRRDCEPPESGLMSDLLWSDPQPFPGRGPSKRGVGLTFGPDITAAFLKDNNLELLIRSHEVKEEGYLVEHEGKCITIFSAPNYCDQMGNKGAIITFGPEMKPNFIQFSAVPHPAIKPMAYASNFGMFGL